MNNNHLVIIVSGLGDHLTSIKISTLHWKMYGLTPLVYSAGWKNDKESFKAKLTKLTKLVDQLLRKGNQVSLIGTSAGASLVLNAFSLRKNKVVGVINVCGRLKIGSLTGGRSFPRMTRNSKAFADSVRASELVIKNLKKNDLARLMTISAKFGDEFVPLETSVVKGAKNIFVPTIEHMVSICATLIFRVGDISRFLVRKTS